MKWIVSSEIIVIENVGKPAGDAELGARAARNAASLRVPLRFMNQLTRATPNSPVSTAGWAPGPAGTGGRPCGLTESCEQGIFLDRG